MVRPTTLIKLVFSCPRSIGILPLHSSCKTVSKQQYQASTNSARSIRKKRLFLFTVVLKRMAQWLVGWFFESWEVSIICQRNVSLMWTLCAKNVNSKWHFKVTFSEQKDYILRTLWLSISWRGKTMLLRAFVFYTHISVVFKSPLLMNIQNVFYSLLSSKVRKNLKMKCHIQCLNSHKVVNIDFFLMLKLYLVQHDKDYLRLLWFFVSSSR